MILRELALKHKTDKAGHHEYCEAYEFFLEKYKHKNITFLEIGIGGYEFTDRGGESLRMWREYFSKAKIFGIDLYPKIFTIKGVNMITGVSQDDGTRLNEVLNIIEIPDVIIDDGSHINALTLQTFRLLFPKLKSGGIYAVEDVHTSYWEKFYGGGWHDKTVMNFFKTQADKINQEHWRDTKKLDDEPNYEISSIHFFKEIIFIIKK